MTDNIIQIKSNNVRRLKIVDIDGKDTGEYLEFQIDDIELPLKYQEITERLKKNKQWVKNQLIIINKRQDVKGKKLFSKNQEDTIKAMNDFFKKQEETYDLFLGKDGVKKLLCGRKMTWETFNEIDDIIEEQIAPYIDQDVDNLVDRITKKYGNDNETKNVIK